MRVKTLSTLIAVAAAVALAVAVTAASGAPAKQHASALAKSHKVASVVIKTRVVAGLGKILVDAKGRTLYMFVPDKRKRVTCVKICAKIWPPIFVAKGAKLVGKGGVEAKLLGSDADPAGGRVATYHGWPLYLYLGDKKAGDAFGQALKLNGGLWYVLAPSGALITKKLHSGGGSGGGSNTTTTTPTTTTSNTCSDADGDGDEDAGGPDDGDGCL